MNDPADIPPTDEETPEQPPTPPTFLGQLERVIRHHPMAATLATVGFGCAVGIAARELLAPTPTPKSRVMHLLEDIQSRLADFAEPAYDRASDLMDDGAKAMKRGAKRVRHLFA
ncbi:MAG: hypothetical protein IAE77_08045 [Prosthecobacter sp.]|jgi:hypothetical protein|uniref:hypothetical protein n=1 Tax=Prosthecobacter sp. TaxID=1965333 RepID=UPI0019EE7046|nr:hypothetical protein [Prosthecobacter sp.]MBE2283398.1 hypothetical protein [Prosthecobacter sp.]